MVGLSQVTFRPVFFCQEYWTHLYQQETSHRRSWLEMGLLASRGFATFLPPGKTRPCQARRCALKARLAVSRCPALNQAPMSLMLLCPLSSHAVFPMLMFTSPGLNQRDYGCMCHEGELTFLSGKSPLITLPYENSSCRR